MSPRSRKAIAVASVAMPSVRLASPATRGQALVEYVLLLSGVVIVCILAVAAIGQAILWASIVDGYRSLR